MRGTGSRRVVLLGGPDCGCEREAAPAFCAVTIASFCVNRVSVDGTTILRAMIHVRWLIIVSFGAASVLLPCLLRDSCKYHERSMFCVQCWRLVCTAPVRLDLYFVALVGITGRSSEGTGSKSVGSMRWMASRAQRIYGVQKSNMCSWKPNHAPGELR